MAETRLQSDMIQNMGRSARAAMLQRGQIAANQREWLDYVYARDSGAFQPSYGEGYFHEEYLPGERQQANTYLKYYQQQQAKQLAFQRQRFLNAQSFQNNYMLQQQKFMLGQAAEEQKVARTRQERERKLAAIRKQQDAIRNNPEVDQNSFETQNMLKQLDAAAFQVETEIGLNPVDIQKIPSGNVDKNNKPIETWIVYENGKPVVIRDGNKVAEGLLNQDKHLETVRSNTMSANTAEKANELKEKELKIREQESKSKRMEAENKASGADVDPEAEAMKQFGQDAHEELMRKRKNEVKEFLKKKGTLKDGQTTEEKDELVQQFIDDDRFEGPTKQEQRDEAMKMWERTQPIPQDRLQEEAMYESPMDPGMEPEFSDEQFAGTEPAGLYDPTGQPLPMDGGMYNGLA